MVRTNAFITYYLEQRHYLFNVTSQTSTGEKLNKNNEDAEHGGSGLKLLAIMQLIVDHI